MRQSAEVSSNRHAEESKRLRDAGHNRLADIQKKRKAGRPSKKFTCDSCWHSMSKKLVRTHKCNPSSGNAESGK